MPLKLIPARGKGKSPNWTIRGTYLGRYVERSSGSPERAVAVKALARIQGEIERGEFSEPGEATFASAVGAYVRAGGIRTKDQARAREARVRLRKLLEHFGDKPLRDIDQSAIDAAATALYPSGTSATRNRQVYTPVCAVLRRGGLNLNLRRPSGSGGNKQTAWLWPEQAEALFTEAEKLNPTFAALLITLCYTGLRLSEALGLTWNDVRLQDGYAYVPDTKNGEPRAVFLPPVSVAALANLLQHKADTPFRFRKSGHLYSLLRVVGIRAGVEFPARSAFHIFRHTYATWMRRYAGADSQGLIATGAWKDRKSVERYAHTIVHEEAKRAAMLPTPSRRKA